MHTNNRSVAPFIPELEQQRYQHLKGLLQASPNQGELWFKLATNCRTLGYLDEAMEAYQKAIEADYKVAASRHFHNVLSQCYQVAKLDGLFQPTPFLQYDDFLSMDELAQIWRIYHLKVERLHHSRIDGDVLNQHIRSSKAINLRGLEEIDFFKRKLTPVLQRAYDYFSISSPKEPKLAIELTTHADNGFYDIHSDVDLDNPVRKLSYIYYFHQLPRSFEGGQLHLFDSDVNENQFINKFTSIEPLHNRLVIFPSEYYHRVFKVSLPSGDEAQGRHTINGWHSDMGN